MNIKSPTPVAIIGDKAKSKAKGLMDGLENLIANLGTNRDKRAHSRFVNNVRLSGTGAAREDLEALYRTDWLAGKAIDIVPDDMTREWRSFEDDDYTPEQIEQLEAEEKRINLVHSVNLAMKWSRLFGTAFVLLGVDDGQDPSLPLNMEGIKPGSLKHIKVIDRFRLTRESEVINDPMDENFGMPRWYRLVNSKTNTRIHASRLLRFDAVMLPYDAFRENNYWADSILDRLYGSLINYNTATDSSASLIYEAQVDVVKIKNLMAQLSTAEGEKLILKRFGLANQLKSLNNMLVLDAEEDFDSHKQTFQGLPVLIEKFSQILSAATDIPATRLLGESAPGMNSNGDSELKNYYDMIAAKQTSILMPALTTIDEIMVRSLDIGDEVPKWNFDSLFQMSDAERADMELKRAQRDDVYLRNEVLTPAIVGKQLQEDKTYSNIDEEHIKELEELENEPDFNELDPTLVNKKKGEEPEATSDETE